VDGNLAQHQRVAERDEACRLLGGHDAGKTGRADHVAFPDVAGEDEVERGGAHADMALGGGDAHGLGLVADVDHACLAGRVDMRQSAARHFTAPVSPERRARVATSTSSFRIRLSPTRKVEIPTLPSLWQSAWVKMPLSPTRSRSSGTIAASVSDVARSTSKVRRLRLLMPMSLERSFSARSISALSWTSTSTSMPS